MSGTENLVICEVSCDEEGERIDKFLCGNLSNISRSQAQELIEQGQVSFEDKIIKNSSNKTKIGIYIYAIIN